MKKGKTAGREFLELLYPQSLYCGCCGNIIDESRTYNLCDHCITHIKWDRENFVQKNGIETARCTEYGIYERTIIFQLKYNGKRYLSRDIGKIMADKMKYLRCDTDIIVPVPMYAAKEKRRGFNQSALIAKYMATELEVSYLPYALIRTADTRPMRGLNPTERELNVKGNFAVNEKYGKMLKGHRILLIDDFYTTGSTARECAEALRSVEPQEIRFLAFAAK